MAKKSKPTKRRVASKFKNKNIDLGKIKEEITKKILPKNANQKEQGIKPYKKGDLVRIRVEIDSRFEKPTNNISYTRSIYEIDKVLTPKAKSVLQYAYKLKTIPDGKPLAERFYPSELLVINPVTTKVTAPEKYIIQRLIELDDRVDEIGNKRENVLVKFKGFPYPEWRPISTIKMDVPKMYKQFLERIQQEGQQ